MFKVLISPVSHQLVDNPIEYDHAVDYNLLPLLATNSELFNNTISLSNREFSVGAEPPIYALIQIVAFFC